MDPITATVTHRTRTEEATPAVAGTPPIEADTLRPGGHG